MPKAEQGNSIDKSGKKNGSFLRIGSKILKHLNDVYVSVLFTQVAASSKLNLLYL